MIKTLAARIRQYKFQTIITPVLMIGEVLMEVLIPFLISDLVDNGITAGDMGHVVFMGCMLLICAFASLAFGAIAGTTASYASAGFAANLRHDMYHNIQNFSFSNIDKFSTSSLVTRLTTDITNVQMSFQMLIRMAFRAPMSLILGMVMCFRINVTLSMVFLCCIPILAVALAFIMLKTHPVFKKVFKTYDKLNRVVQENLHGVRVVKSFVREDHEISKFEDVSEQIYSGFSKAEKTLAFNSPVMQLCVYGCMIAISWMGAQMIVASGNQEALGMTTGQLMSVMSYVMQILMSLMMLSMVFVMITMSRASAERVTAVLNEEADLTSPENADIEVTDGSIDFNHVNFSYSGNEKRLALKDIDLHIHSGETIGIIGGTGSAKSTFVQMIPRLYDVTSGSVMVGGKDVRSYDLDALRMQVAMVLQKNELFSGTIKDNLRWGNENASDEEIERVCKLAQADSFIQEFPAKYDTYIEQGGTNVSGGQKQRLCIARALLKKPKILILDDSTSAVDTKTDAMIREAFRTEIPDTTKLIIAQRISSVQDADRIIVLDNGRVIDFGSHEELMEKSDIYREVFTSQTKGSDKDA